MNYLGVDIGGTAVKVGLISDMGEVLERQVYDACFDGYATPLLKTAIKSTEAFVNTNGILLEQLGGIGISATGLIDVNRGVVVGTAGHIKNWLGSPIMEEFHKMFGLKVRVTNDANSAVAAEQWIGRAKGCKNVVMITVGTGIGGGVIVDSKILNGCMGIAGELGHFSINKDGLACPCGVRGCYDIYASTTALVERVKEAYNTLNLSYQKQEIDGRKIFQLIGERNAEVEAIADKWMDDVACGLIGLTHIFNPEMILIGGGVSKQDKLFIEPVRKKVMKGIMPRYRDFLRIEAAALGNDAGMIGAVYGLIFQ